MWLLATLQLRDTEIIDLGMPAFHQHDVLRLDVLVDHAVTVGKIKGGGNLSDQIDHHRQRRGALTNDPIRQGLSAQSLHRDVGMVIGLAHVIDGDDVGMGQGAGGARLGKEASSVCLVTRHLVPEALDGQLAIDAGIKTGIDYGHCPFAKHALDPVTTDGRRGLAGGHVQIR